MEKEKNAKINEKKKKDESEAQVVYSKNILLTKYNYYVILFIITYHKYIFFYLKEFINFLISSIKKLCIYSFNF